MGKLVVMLSFTLKENPKAITYVIVMPSLMLIFTLFRNSALPEASERPDDLGQDMLDFVGDAAYNYSLIADFARRPVINDMFAAKCDEWRKAKVSPGSVRVNNEYFTHWLGPVFVGCYIISHAREVLLDARLGTFVATLSVFSEISG